MKILKKIEHIISCALGINKKNSELIDLQKGLFESSQRYQKLLLQRQSILLTEQSYSATQPEKMPFLSAQTSLRPVLFVAPFGTLLTFSPSYCYNYPGLKRPDKH